MILVLNSGSSSLKFKLFAWKDLSPLARGLIERIGKPQAKAHLQTFRGEKLERTLPLRDHREALELMEALLKESGLAQGARDLQAIGHRVVHGGEHFREPILLNAHVLQELKDLIPLAPLHNPANLLGIELALEHAPNVPQIAVFDTAFHRTLPPRAYLYALPYQIYERYQVRRYGFHGLSHAYVAREAARFLGRPLSELKLITLHLGNGASATAILHGQSVDTSMGFTPLEGLIMGTRCGDLDPAVIFYLAREHGYSYSRLEEMLNRESGLRGLAGDNDMRLLTQRATQGDARARLAIEMFCYRIKKYIGAYWAVLNGADALVFTGGIGENSSLVRAKACEGLTALGIQLDPEKNQRFSGQKGDVSASHSQVKILVIPTNEELEIARKTKALVPLPSAKPGPET